MFDIIVPTYNRYSELPFFFSKLEKLDKSLYTLWLIDDCSSNKDKHVLPAWPNLEFIELTKNVGQAGARNYAIEKGKALFIISLDDDAWFMDDNISINKIADAFEKYEDAGCLMFNIATPNSSFLQGDDGIILPLHVTCGCAYRRSALEQIGGFNSIFQGQAEESDISLKLYKKEWKIRSLYSIRVFHDFNPDNRPVKWYRQIRYKETRNSLIVVFLHYPFFYALLFIPGKAISHLFYAIKAKKAIVQTFLFSVKGIFDFLFKIPKLIRSRDALTTKQFRYWKNLKQL